MKMYYIIFLLIICIPGSLSAECDSVATGKICVGLVYGRSGSNAQMYTLVVENYIHGSGHYGGGCNTYVGRKKARRRACASLKNTFYSDYATWKGQADFVCRMAIKATGFENNTFDEVVQQAEWLRVDHFELIDTKTQNGDRCGKGDGWAGGSIDPGPEIYPQRVEFYCRNGQAFMR